MRYNYTTFSGKKGDVVTSSQYPLEPFDLDAHENRENIEISGVFLSGSQLQALFEKAANKRLIGWVKAPAARIYLRDMDYIVNLGMVTSYEQMVENLNAAQEEHSFQIGGLFWFGFFVVE